MSEAVIGFPQPLIEHIVPNKFSLPLQRLILSDQEGDWYPPVEVTGKQISLYVEAVKDSNPMHVPSATRKAIAPGGLVAGMLPSLVPLYEEIIGLDGTVTEVSASHETLKLVFEGDRLCARVKVTQCYRDLKTNRVIIIIEYEIATCDTGQTPTHVLKGRHVLSLRFRNIHTDS